MQEASSIPYEPTRLRGERLLVLAPHPDDEAIGCGGLVAQHLAEERMVRVAIATDGAQAGDAAVREEESRRGIGLLGRGAEVMFFRFPDRALAEKHDELVVRVYRELIETKPDLVLVPSPVEIHPDHIALSRAFCEVIQRHETLFADLATTRVAFYEVSQPLRPNVLVDITDVAETKFTAIAAHESQMRQRDYSALARGLNAYRAMTLPAPATFAEGYWVVGLPEVRTTAFSELWKRVGSPRDVEVIDEHVPISVVIRTKDRPALLREAIASVRASGYPCEIVVVNDGGAAVEVVGATLVVHDRPKGRSVAANEGVRAASNAFVTFLDDDDLHYPEHLTALARASKSNYAGWYTDAVSAFLRIAPSGNYETYSRQRLYGQDFDREVLLADNYIPLPTLLVPRATFLDLGGFDAAFDLFEDWDFLIRLSGRGKLLHVPRVTCEVRHFEGGSSIILTSTGAESPRAREAKLQVWRKHGIGEEVLVTAFERQKRRMAQLFSDSVDARGERGAAQRDVLRLEREKSELLAQIAAIHNELNGAMLRTRELEGAVAIGSGAIGALEAKTIEAERLAREVDDVRRHNAEASAAIEAMRVEIGRLNGLLDMIFRSRTWKLHTALEKLRGRG